MKVIKKYIWNNLIAIDQLFNTVTGGDPDETISSRVGKRMRSGNPGYLARSLCYILEKLDPGHCQDSIEDDEGKDSIKNYTKE